MNEDEGKFITMPLCWLTAPYQWPELIGRAISYGIAHYLLTQWETEAELKANASDAENLARKALGLSGGALGVWLKQHAEVSRFEREFLVNHGKTFHPRLDLSLAFDSRNGETSEREMRVHLALLSALGSKGYIRLGWMPIQWRAAGYLRRPPDGATTPLLSRGQIDRALHALVGRHLWTCYSYCGRGKRAGERYWTNRKHIPLEKLVALVHAAKARDIVFDQQQQRAQEIAAQLRSVAAS